MTAEEVTEELLRQGLIPYFDLNFARPRITEMSHDGLIDTVGKRESMRTGKKTAIWVCVDLPAFKAYREATAEMRVDA